ncbi:MAG TPA: gamma-glutamyl-gamma-aminobutyrate hydrolase family protein [Bacteriovoracaceae bacterium]|nr:gamma-glutamyl-gamma-aminobutyrate hydrolase family protein [Bacteriovoracaceae bacterium]
MKLHLFLFFIAFNLSNVLAQTEIKIGCAYTCDSSTESALKQTSKSFPIKLKLIDLTKVKEVKWNELHGIVIPGGVDINPKYYLQHVEPDLQAYTRNLDHLVEYTRSGEARDAFEYSLLRDYYTNPSLTTFPMLGLCRGMQIMSVALGIPLYVDIKTELGIENRRDLYDQIEVADVDSIMAKIFPVASFPGYKNHHQGLRVSYYMEHKKRWPNVKVTAFSNNKKIAEGLELLDRPALGVQFHPEADDNSVRKYVFTWFLKKAIERKDAEVYQ